MAWPYTASELVSIIGSLALAAGSVIGTLVVGVLKILAFLREIKANTAYVLEQQAAIQQQTAAVKAQAGVIEEKMDVVHVQTNSQLSRLEEKLTAAESREAALFAALTQAEKTRLALEASTAENARVTVERAASVIINETDRAAQRAHTQASQQHATPGTESVESVTITNDESNTSRIILP